MGNSGFGIERQRNRIVRNGSLEIALAQKLKPTLDVRLGRFGPRLASNFGRTTEKAEEDEANPR
jgi:hypothetical protein